MKNRLNNYCNLKWAHPEVRDEAFLMEPDVRIFSNPEELEKNRMERYGPSSLDTLDKNGDEIWMQWRNTGFFTTYYTEHGCSEEEDAPPVRILVRIPKDIMPEEKLPVLFIINGGGLTNGGTPEAAMRINCEAILKSGVRCVMVSLQYRLAPQYKYPASLNDCHAAYLWMQEHAENLQIDLDKVVLSGMSSGGHMALALGFRLKRYGYHGKMPRGIIAIEPVMDDAAVTNSMTVSFDDVNGESRCWDGACVQRGMRAWLGDLFGDVALPPEAVPARATLEDIKGYPPVWFPLITEFETSRDTVYKFVALLHEANIFCDLHVWGGTNHASIRVGSGSLHDRIFQGIGGAMRDAMTYDFRREWLSIK